MVCSIKEPTTAWTRIIAVSIVTNYYLVYYIALFATSAKSNKKEKMEKTDTIIVNDHKGNVI